MRSLCVLAVLFSIILLDFQMSNNSDKESKPPRILEVIVDESHCEWSEAGSTHSDRISESSDDPEEEIYKNLTTEQLRRARECNECFICQKRCDSFSSFRRHVVQHTSSKKYKCEQCAKTFSKIRYLKAHWTTHNDNRVFTCEICSQNFRTKPSIRGHMRTHTGTLVWE